jgi:FSR family fosmidomycin resistance protein-like MFS transporter
MTNDKGGSPRQPSHPSSLVAGRLSRALRSASVLAFTLLAIEFLDEFVFGAREAAWPLIRNDLGLNYAQVGMLLSLPNIASNLIEPFLGILGDVWKRRALILGGGVIFALAVLLSALSSSFLALLASFILFYPASGAFVSLSQAALMDTDAARHEHNMARWTFAGSLGVVTGSLALGAATTVGLGWRGLFGLLAALSLFILTAAWRFPSHAYQPMPPPTSHDPPSTTHHPLSNLRIGLANALRALQRREILRWLTLLMFSDLMLDVLLGFLALYMVDIVGVTPAQGGLAVAVWTSVGLAGDFLLIPLLERVRGLSYLRVSAVIEFVLFTTFLLAPGLGVKLTLLGLLGFFNAGWYSILQGQLYTSMPGQSGTVMALGNIFGWVSGFIPLVLGWVAQAFDLRATMWLLLLGPVALMVALPRPGEITRTR